MELCRRCHMQIDGRSIGLRGMGNGAARLTEHSVRQIRKLFDEGRPRKLLAIQFGISIAHINQIGYRVRWGWLL